MDSNAKMPHRTRNINDGERYQHHLFGFIRFLAEYRRCSGLYFRWCWGFGLRVTEYNGHGLMNLLCPCVVRREGPQNTSV
jgi:hypothetical protein